MLPFNDFNVITDKPNILDQWMEISNEKNSDSSKINKFELFRITRKIANDLKNLKSDKKWSEYSEHLASIIAHSFDKYSTGEIELLAQWIASNQAYDTFNKLFKAVIKSHTGSETNSLDKKLINNPLSSIDYVNKAAYQYRLKQIILPPEVLGLITKKAGESNDLQPLVALKQTSKRMRQQAISAFNGPLKKIKITTATEAIARCFKTA